MKCTRTERKFKVDFLENKASNEKFLFYIFDFFFRVESPPFRLYHQLPTTLYIISGTSDFFICFFKRESNFPTVCILVLHQINVSTKFSTFHVKSTSRRKCEERFEE